MMITILILFKNTNDLSNNKKYKKDKKLLEMFFCRFNDKFIYYQYLILKREKFTFKSIFGNVFFADFVILGMLFNMNTLFTRQFKMVMFFVVIANFELSETLLKKILSIENDKSIIRHLINNNLLLKFIKSKIKMYFLIYNITNIFLVLPILLLGNTIDIIGLIITINMFSLIYSFNSVITNIVKPDFQLLKNEEVEGTLANDIMNAFLKIASLTIYYSLGIGLFAYNYLNKISNMTLWAILIIIMVSHLCILYLFYKILLSKKIWSSWEGF
ncbi:hypothetical protein [Clostridium lacusfryxellense]|uniref:hypothetical protein n=1 Tax=Clostridium lacusfryxellense TaxID=205328 RepID=UPI001C0DC605|nr:hypothetical protein [Clostridium lacusfryxellense]MBU3114775.1 hypothetical protein [Clostridium lacusfryxellense]